MRETIIGLMKTGKTAKQIPRLLKPLKVSECFVYRVLALYNDTGDIVDRPRSGWPRTARTKKVVAAKYARINRNPVRRWKTITKEMNIASKTLSRLYDAKERKNYSVCTVTKNTKKYCSRMKKFLR